MRRPSADAAGGQRNRPLQVESAADHPPVLHEGGVASNNWQRTESPPFSATNRLPAGGPADACGPEPAECQARVAKRAKLQVPEEDELLRSGRRSYTQLTFRLPWMCAKSRCGRALTMRVFFDNNNNIPSFPTYRLKPQTTYQDIVIDNNTHTCMLCMLYYTPAHRHRHPAPCYH